MNPIAFVFACEARSRSAGGRAGLRGAALVVLVAGGCAHDTSPQTPVAHARDAGNRDAVDAAAPPVARMDATNDVVAPDGTALRLTFSPETITTEAEAGLDGRGFLRVRVFDVASVVAGRGSTSGNSPAPAEPLHEERVPRDSGAGAEISVSELPAITIPLPGEQGSVFVEAVFFDQPPPAHGPEPLFGWGWWVGGMDLSRGLSQNVTLEEIPLTRGQVTTHDVPLVAYRRVHVTATVGATPPGDGQGSLSVAASRVPVLPPRAPTFGYGIVPCVDLDSGTQHVDIGVIGSGDFYVAGFFDDLGIKTPGSMPPGTMISVRDVDLATYTGTFDRLTLAPRQYSGTVTMDLGYVVPLPPGFGPAGPNSCQDLGYLVDAGP